jgi:hypothetical protein
MGKCIMTYALDNIPIIGVKNIIKLETTYIFPEEEIF